MKRLLSVLCLLLWAAVGHAATYGTANESTTTTGTVLTATGGWQATLAAATPGTTYLLRNTDGATFTASGPITVSGASVTVKPYDGQAINVVGRWDIHDTPDGLTVAGLTLTGTDQTYTVGTSAAGSATITFRNNRIHGGNLSAFRLRHANTGWTIQGNDISNVDGQASCVTGLIDFNPGASFTIKDNKLDTKVCEDTIHLENWSGNVLIEGNWFPGAFPSQSMDNIIDLKSPSAASSAITIRKNYFQSRGIDNASSITIHATTAVPTWPASTTCLLEGNYIEDAFRAVRIGDSSTPGGPCTFRQNVFVGTDASAEVFGIIGSAANNQLDGNTFHNGTFLVQSASSGAVLKNNIFSAVTFSINSADVTSCQGNAFSSTSPATLSFCTGNNTDSPQFVDTVTRDFNSQRTTYVNAGTTDSPFNGSARDIGPEAPVAVSCSVEDATPTKIFLTWSNNVYPPMANPSNGLFTATIAGAGRTINTSVVQSGSDTITEHTLASAVVNGNTVHIDGAYGAATNSANIGGNELALNIKSKSFSLDCVNNVGAGAPAYTLAQTHFKFTRENNQISVDSNIDIVAGSVLLIDVQSDGTGDVPAIGQKLRYTLNGGAITPLSNSMTADNLRFFGNTENSPFVPPEGTPVPACLVATAGVDVAGATQRTSAAVPNYDLGDGDCTVNSYAIIFDTDAVIGSVYRFYVEDQAGVVTIAPTLIGAATIAAFPGPVASGRAAAVGRTAASGRTQATVRNPVIDDGTLDTTAPTVALVGDGIINESQNSAVCQATTNERGNFACRWSVADDGVYEFTTPVVFCEVGNCSATMTGISSGQTRYGKAFVTDIAGNEGSSAQFEFTTTSLSTIYVGKSGSDANSCATALSSVATDRKLTIAAGLACLNGSEDTLVIGDGTYQEYITNAQIVSGTGANSNIVIKAENQRQAILKPVTCTPTSGTNNVVWISGKKWITFDGLVFDAENCTGTGGAMFFNGTGTVPSSDITLINNEIKNAQPVGNCLTIQGGPVPTGFVVRGNLIHDCGDPATNQYHGIYPWGTGHLIEENEVYNIGSFGIHQFKQSASDSGSNIIRYNTIHNVDDACIITGSGDDNQVYGNICYSSGGGIRISSGSARRTKVYNNTIYLNGYGIQVGTSSTNVFDTEVKNNFLLDNTTNTIAISAGSTGTVQANNTASTDDTLVTDAPGGNFMPRSGSALRNGGTTTGLPSGYAFLGSAPDIGAVEFDESLADTCTHFAGPTAQGTGNGSSDANRFLPSGFNSVGSFGTAARVLCLAGGTYTGSTARLWTTTSMTGTAAFPVIIRATDTGSIPLFSGAGTRPINLEGTHIYLQDVNAKNGDNSTVKIHSNCTNCKVQRVVAWNDDDTVSPLANAIFDMQGSNNLMEDIVGFGTGRKVIGVTTSVSGNEVRRCFGRWEGAPDAVSGPTIAGQFGYGQNSVKIANCIFTRDHMAAKGVVEEPEGGMATFRCDNCRQDGIVYYNNSGDTVHGTAALDYTNDAGTGAPVNSNDNYVVNGIVSVIPTGQTTMPMRFASNSSYPAGSNNVVSNAYSVGDTTSTLATRSWTGTITHVATVGALPDTLWNLAGSRFCKRVEAGVVTATNLWPWPMNQRAIDAFTAAGYTGADIVDITAKMEEIFGAIPAGCGG